MTLSLNKGSPGDPFSLGAAIAPLFILLLILSFFQPFHSAPWPAAISDGISIFSGFAIFVLAWSSKKLRPVQMSVEEAITILLLVAHVLWFGMTSVNRGIAPYVLLISIAYLCFKLTKNRKDILLLVMIGIAIAALLTALIGIGQFLGAWDSFPGRFMWMTDREAGKPLAGNLGQPNNAGSLFIWGLISCVTLEKHYRPNPIQNWLSHPTMALTTFCVLLLSLAAALTHSRTASLEMLFLGTLVIFYRRICGPRIVSLTFMGVAVHFLTVLCLPALKAVLFDAQPFGAFGGKGIIDGVRLYAYPLFLTAITEKPFLGYGLGGVTTAYISSAPLNTGVGQYFGHTHNIVLEILVWFGIPLGGWLIYRLGGKLAKCIRSSNSLLELAAAAMIVTILIHAMLELPLHYAYFLIPFSVMCAQLPNPESKNLFRLSSGTIFAAVAILGTLFVLVSLEYLRLEQDIRTARLQLALMGRTDLPSRERAHFLPELKNADVMLRTPVTDGMEPEQLQLFETTVWQFPQRPLIEKYSQAQRMNGRPDEAQRWLNLGCAVYRVNGCKVEIDGLQSDQKQ